MKKYSFLFSYFKQAKILSLFFLMIISSVLTLLPPYLVSYILDEGVAKTSIETITYCSIFLGFVYICSFAVNYFISQNLTKTSSYFIADLKNDLFTKILKLPMEFFDKQQTGYIFERIKETESLNVFFSPVFLKFVTSIVSFVGALVLVCSIRWELFLILLLFLPVIYYFTNHSSIKIKKASKALLETTAQTSGKVQENIGGISAVKELKMENQRSSEISRQLKQVADKSVKRGKMMNIASEGIVGITNIASVLLIVFSGIFIMKGKMSLGNYWAVSQYALLIFAPMQLLASISIMVQPGIAALTRINELLKLKTEDEICGNRQVGKIENIIFSDVSFGYSEKTVIDNFNMAISRNEKVALLGKNGSGKTTIAKLLLGFYKNYSGSIRINDIEIKNVSLLDLRNRVGIVAQNIVLFSGTLLDNIRFIAPQLDEREIISALSKAGLDISEFAGGLQAVISENGKNLSGGQKQKIALARMIIKNPDVMIFDEATSNLDIETSNLVKQSIHTIFAEKTGIIITHDPDMASLADTIIKI